MCLICATFTFRYFVVTRSHTNAVIVRSLTALNFSPAILWFIAFLMTDPPGLTLRKRLNRDYGERFAVDFEKIYIFAMETTLEDLDPQKIFSAFFNIIQAAVIISTGVSIYRTIQNSVESDRSKEVQRKAFRLLLCQVICPMIMLHIPSILNCTQTEIAQLPDWVNRTSVMFMNAFPVANPLLTIFLSSDISNSLRNRLARKKSSSISIVISTAF
ncbi:hypothetical protein PMAYCL1PPCAC_22865 [Pristionchus mayeri]|uniref:G protein-coupled receptor n=1 Tax=Pristionchus mayeri TaxID=1317129 RepID=A0AAN5CXU5_9BILA|nr:hypothetical protein PMAYCL1PPCAC_22865 [Pristionchus mayeri]